MKNLILTIAIVLVFGACNNSPSEQVPDIKTVCNPMDLSYRFRPETEEVSRREAADPTVISFKGEYWLFASKSGGYWYSKDLTEWTFIQSGEIPTEDYAPTVIEMRDTLFLAISSKKNDKVYKCVDPKSGHWMAENTLSRPVEDPCFFRDDDGKLYLYWGCSNVNPLYGAEIDSVTFKFKSEVHELIFPNPQQLGWEVRGDYNTEYDNAPWLEGCWMNKHEGKYYLQYSAPGTVEKSYSDGVYVAENPLGPFELAQNNPFAYKPEGFACGAGHGSTIEDAYGNWWHLGTISISVKHKFERRVGFYPAFFDADGVLYSYTRFGDYPTIIPDHKISTPDEIFPGWMLLSYKKNVKVSSSTDGYPATNMVNEDIRSYWAAHTGDSTEWASVDLGSECDIRALQINFAEHNTNLYNRQPDLRHRYLVEVSNDEKNWKLLLDKSANNVDCSHDYTQLAEKVNARFIRVKNREVPGGSFAISGFRVFGLGKGQKPGMVQDFIVERNASDRRQINLSWEKVEGATGYNIRYGVAPDKLYLNYLVYDSTQLTIRSLNSMQDYFYAIEAFNGNGVGSLYSNDSPTMPMQKGQYKRETN